MLDPAFLQILRCPATRGSLRLLTADELSQLNAAIQQGSVSNQIGVALTLPCDGALLNEAQTLIYAVWNDVPQLVANEAISASGLGLRLSS